MNKIQSLADLQKLREEQQKTASTREDSGIKVIIGMGTCGIAAGARQVMLTMLEEINKRGLDVNITQTGCIGMCEKEPLVDVVIPGNDRITYGRVTKELAERIVLEHIVDGNIVRESVVGKIEKQ